jgi:hypothetical protein
MGLGSGIRKKPIPDPGVKKAPDPGSGSATLQQTMGLKLLLETVHFTTLTTILFFKACF